jgi:leucyl aminopeptidase
MPELIASRVSEASAPADVLLLPVLSGHDDSPARVLAPDELTGIADALGPIGGKDAVTRIPSPAGVAASSVVLVGLGTDDLARADGACLRRAFGNGVRSLTGTGVGHVAIAVPEGTRTQLAAAAEGAALAAYAFTGYKTGPSADEGAPVARITVLAGEIQESELAADLERAGVLSDVVDLARDLVNTPPNVLCPAEFARRAEQAVQDLPVEITVLDEEQLADGGYGGIVGVGQGSARPPRLVHLHYAPEHSSSHVGLVGKGITFDTGGISLKPPAGMDEMTSDMTGAATVLAATVGAARLGLPVTVDCFLAIAENMPGGGAQRPGDVVVMRDGRTVEVLNTDAEGRMVMADALVDAAATGAELVLDVATLTGAAVVALGTRTAAVIGTEQARSEVLAAADVAGEPFWPLPMPEELRAQLDGRVADLRNIGDREGGALIAGVFLSEFVGTTPWAHLDIAGPAFASKPQGYMGVGATGMSVRTVLAVLEARAS